MKQCFSARLLSPKTLIASQAHWTATDDPRWSTKSSKTDHWFAWLEQVNWTALSVSSKPFQAQPMIKQVSLQFNRWSQSQSLLSSSKRIRNKSFKLKKVSSNLKIELDSKPMPPLLKWPTIESQLSHLPHLKQLIFTVFTDNRIKGDRPFKQLDPQLGTYLADSRVKGPLSHLDLNLNESVFGPAEDYSALLPLMPQLVHFGLNAEETGDSVMQLLMAASSRLTSFKVDIVHCKESDFEETSEIDEQTDMLNISSKTRAQSSSLRSLLL